MKPLNNSLSLVCISALTLLSAASPAATASDVISTEEALLTAFDAGAL